MPKSTIMLYSIGVILIAVIAWTLIIKVCLRTSRFVHESYKAEIKKEIKAEIAAEAKRAETQHRGTVNQQGETYEEFRARRLREKAEQENNEKP